MYRSRGELRSYALRVFALYSTNGVLSVPLFKLAWYVLWGKQPDVSVMQLLDDTGVNENPVLSVMDENNTAAAERISSVDEGVSSGEAHVSYTEISPHTSLSSAERRRRIQEEEFLRLVVAYYDTMGIEAAVFTTTERTPNNIEEMSAGTPRGVIRAARWAHFEALAGPKGYVTLEDILATEHVDWLRRPLCKAEREGSWEREKRGTEETCENSPWNIGDHATSTESDNNGRMALLSHAFAIADGDHDGRIVFSDMECHLSG
ncbi:uncharacterized protein TM35_000043630 [Trypanosoma theileri]|uniref:Uncharacterized protein n=1 Tax=Trypanosoma theileri TaxID=67003 RepID=A0A1X0P6G1_9TRYP|nr:uncharacterized protein TM35_000043630 [Trypanosoma theileri]ORC92149.1 hypothetical protein TM35_000043630 [Trypanosoma theileri]